MAALKMNFRHQEDFFSTKASWRLEKLNISVPVQSSFFMKGNLAGQSTAQQHRTDRPHHQTDHTRASSDGKDADQRSPPKLEDRSPLF